MANIFGWIGMREEQQMLVRVRGHVTKVQEVVRLLKEALEACGRGDKEQVDALHERLGAAEHEADEIRRDLLSALSEGMLLPPDRNDLVHLIERIDDVADAAHGASRMLVLFDGICPVELKQDLVDFADVLVQATKRLSEALVSLYKNPADVTLKKCTLVEELEEECDRRKADLLRRILNMDLPAGRLLMLRDLVDSMEATADKAEDSADVIRNLAVRIKK